MQLAATLAPRNTDARTGASIVRAEVSARHVVVTFDDGHVSRYGFHWLRDNCSTGGDKLSAVRTYTFVDADPDLAAQSVSVEDGRLALVWPDGHRTSFDPAWLRAHCSEIASTQTRRHPLTLWSGEELQDDLPTADFEVVASDPDAHAQMLKLIHTYGFVLMQNVPATAEGTERLAEQVGYVRETDFGRIFDIISEPKVWEMSQSQEALHPHTDDPYRYSPPGISILHCLEASESGGGTSQLVDGFAAATTLREEDPRAFELLATVAIPFVRYREDPVPQGKDVRLQAVATVISLDRDGEIGGIRFHERSMGPLDVDPDIVDDYYKAMMSFAKLLYGPRFMVTRHLEAGEAFVFDNQRALHGRSAFAGRSGRRHLRICSMDRDAFHSRVRQAFARTEGKRGWDALPQGATY